MTLRSTLLDATVLALLILASTDLRAAERDDTGFYLGVAAGQARYQLDQAFYARPGADDVDVNLDQSPDVHALHAGWQANRFLAVELALADFGRTERYTPCYSPGHLHVCAGFTGPYRMSEQRADLSLVTTLPLGAKWELLGKMGLARRKYELSAPDYDPDTGTSPFRPYDDKYDTGVLFGVGVRFRLDKSWAVRAQWDHATTRVSAANTELHEDPETDLDSFLLGVEYWFGK